MTENLFSNFLVGASRQAVKFAQQFVYEKLPFDFLYDVELNKSCDADVNPAEFVTYPEEEPLSYTALSADAVVALLWRDGFVPVWIDISAKSISRGRAVLRLLCAGRYSDQPEKCYYWDRGTGPFGVKSPDIPYSTGKHGRKFWLCPGGWRRIFRWLIVQR